MAGIGGRVAFVGVAQQPFTALAGDLIWRELALLGSCRFTRDDIRAVVDLHLAGVLSVDHLLQRVRPSRRRTTRSRTSATGASCAACWSRES